LEMHVLLLKDKQQVLSHALNKTKASCQRTCWNSSKFCISEKYFKMDSEIHKFNWTETYGCTVVRPKCGFAVTWLKQ
jgi:hypothetical protein